MTLQDLAAIEGDVLSANDVADYLNCSPQLIREQARTKPELLGFKVIVVGSRTMIPKMPFINYMGGLNHAH